MELWWSQEWAEGEWWPRYEKAAGLHNCISDSFDTGRSVRVTPLLWLLTLVRQPGPTDSSGHFHVTSQASLRRDV